MSEKSAKRKASNIIAYILLLLVIAGVFGFVAYFTNGFTGDFKPFYVTVNGKNVLSETSGVKIAPNAPIEAEVKYTFQSVDKSVLGFHLEIVPATDFEFTVDGETHSYAEEKNLRDGFEITENETTFSITPKGTLTNILAGIYPNCEVKYNKSDVPLNKDLFKLIVYSVDKTEKVIIGFTLTDLTLDGVRLDKEVIVF